MNDLISELKKKEENLKESIAKVRGLLELDKDKVKVDETLFYELKGRLMEIQQILKSLEEK